MKTPAKTKIFLVEDEPVFQEMLHHYLQDKLGYQVTSYSNGEECLKNIYKNPDIVLLDYNLLDQNGLDVLKEIKSINSDIHVLLVSGQKNIPVAVDVLKYGAFDYVVKNEKVYEVIGEKISQIGKLSLELAKRRHKRVGQVMAFSILGIVICFLGLFKLLS